MRKHKFAVLFTLVIGLAYCGCQGSGKTDPKALPVAQPASLADTVIQGISNPLSGIAFDSTELASFFKKFPAFAEFKSAYLAFYRSRDYNYAWYDQKGIIEQASVLLAHLQETSNRYISYEIPYKDTLHKLFLYEDSKETKAQGKPDITSELLLTGEYFHYAKKRWGQRLDGSPESVEWYLPRKKLDYAGLLDETIKGQDYDSITNRVMNQHYLYLRKALNRYRELDKAYPNDVPAIGFRKNVRPGDTSSTLPQIRQKLQMFGFLQDTTGGNLYTPSLAVSVNRYRKSIGLKQDSVISKEVVTALNVPIRKRVETILVNLERLRWVPAIPAEGEMILVNIPEYMLHYYDQGKKEWECNVVIGKPMTKTVVFSGNIKHVVFSPYWYVPPSIIAKEIRPGMQRNPNYLAAHNMEWNGGNVRQKPGPRNSLGRVKFIFPNSNNIYMHDTPAKDLFNEDARAFSHGCVRVAKPRDLAILLLKDQPEWTTAKIDAAMNAGVEKFVPVKRNLPVYIGYFTAFVDANGDVNFRKDIYSRDGRLYEMLTKN